MSNPTGNPNFVKGHTLTKGIGRPKKAEVIKALEELRQEVNKIPDTLLKALAVKDPVTLKQSAIPMSQVNELIQTLAAGRLWLKERLEQQ